MKRRVAFTIVLNGEHHLLHNQYARKLAAFFDGWVIVEGAAKSKGSTKWCKSMPDKYHNNGRSVDSTLAILTSLSLEHPNMYVVQSVGMWDSKDNQVKSAAKVINYYLRPKFVWQIDVDEQWDFDVIEKAEESLLSAGGKTGCFLANHFVGADLLAVGEWGEGRKLPYKRLWKWENDDFLTHEPPELVRGNGKEVLLPFRFNHYAYYFEKDVAFKDEWYGGHDGIYKRWTDLQLESDFPQPISRLITGHWGRTNTKIVRV